MSFTPFSAAELTSMRGVITATLTDTCSTVRNVETFVGNVPTVTPTAILTNAPCSLRIAGRSFQVQEAVTPTDRQEDTAQWYLLIAIGADIKLMDIVTVGSLTYRVVGTDTGRTHPLVQRVLMDQYTQ